jgi:hypothetical protein
LLVKEGKEEEKQYLTQLKIELFFTSGSFVLSLDDKEKFFEFVLL